MLSYNNFLGDPTSLLCTHLVVSQRCWWRHALIVQGDAIVGITLTAFETQVASCNRLLQTQASVCIVVELFLHLVG